MNKFYIKINEENGKIEGVFDIEANYEIKIYLAKHLNENKKLSSFIKDVVKLSEEKNLDYQGVLDEFYILKDLEKIFNI